MADNKAITGYVLLAFGGLLILLAVILVIVVIHRRKKLKKRANSPDTFKVVYNVPMANGATTKVAASELFDGKSVHTITRSEPGYAYVQPSVPMTPVLQLPPSPPPVSPPPIAPESVIIRAPSAMAAASGTLPRAASVDQLDYVTMPRAGYRYVYPSGTSSRLIMPISKKKAKKLRKQNASKPLYIPVYSGNAAPRAQSLVSAPAYATSVRSMASGPRTLTAEQRNKYYLYGSTPNLHASSFTQPVLMYDAKRKHFHADEIAAGRNDHVQHWLHHEHPTSVQVEHMDIGRPASHASSAPSDLDARRDDSIQALHLKWSPSMRRRLAEMDRREAVARSERISSSDAPPDSPRRYQPLQQHYRELTETF